MLEHLNATATPPDRVVIMGAQGFVGSAIARHLQDKGINVLALGRADIDLLESNAAQKLADKLQPKDAFVAISAMAPCKDIDMLKDNLTIIQALSRTLKQSPVDHILNIGSDAIYADSPDPLEETSCASPDNPHGIMHLAREAILREAAGDTPFASLRPTLIYGLHDPHNGYGPNRFRRLAAEGKEIVLFGEGEERRDHIWVEDVADLAVRILLHKSQGALNAATGTVISFREAAEKVSSLFAHKTSITGSPRVSPMPHNGYRPFNPKATKSAFPDFAYAQPEQGFAKIHAEVERVS